MLGSQKQQMLFRQIGIHQGAFIMSSMTSVQSPFYGWTISYLVSINGDRACLLLWELKMPDISFLRVRHEISFLSIQLSKPGLGSGRQGQKTHYACVQHQYQGQGQTLEVLRQQRAVSHLQRCQWRHYNPGGLCSEAIAAFLLIGLVLLILTVALYDTYVPIFLPNFPAPLLQPSWIFFELCKTHLINSFFIFIYA